MTQTLFASEVKTYQQIYICDNVGLSLINDPNNVPPPTANPYTVAPEYNGGCRLYLLGHTEWSDGNSHATGFTTAWPPNFVTIGAATGVDMDVNGINEEDGGPTFAAITLRSWHPLGVQSLMGDGSVQFFATATDGNVWRSSVPSAAAIGSMRCRRMGHDLNPSPKPKVQDRHLIGCWGVPR